MLFHFQSKWRVDAYFRTDRRLASRCTFSWPFESNATRDVLERNAQRRRAMSKVSSRWKTGAATCLVIAGICMSVTLAHAQSAGSSAATSDSPQAMQERITKLEAEVQALTATVKQLESSSKNAPVSNSAAVPAPSGSQAAPH